VLRQFPVYCVLFSQACSVARRMHVPGDAVSVAVHGYSPGINAVSQTLDVNAFSKFL
jgi:hypothetical protein